MGRGELKFPVKGVNKNWGNSEQPPVTSPDINNVRPYGVAENRLRGGQRPGLLDSDYNTALVGLNFPIVEILSVTYLE
jgi:hypothetical protein